MCLNITSNHCMTSAHLIMENLIQNHGVSTQTLGDWEVPHSVKTHCVLRLMVSLKWGDDLSLSQGRVLPPSSLYISLILSVSKYIDSFWSGSGVFNSWWSFPPSPCCLPVVIFLSSFISLSLLCSNSYGIEVKISSTYICSISYLISGSSAFSLFNWFLYEYITLKVGNILKIWICSCIWTKKILNTLYLNRCPWTNPWCT